LEEEKRMNKYLKKLFINNIFFGFLFINLVVLTDNAFADPNVLLGEAIKNATKLKGKLPTKERLKAYENIFKSLDKIVDEHPSSDQAIKILSDQKIGNFDPSTLRVAYINDLTGYYDTVCEASPSYSCLGFVSLKTGNEQCTTASNIDEIVEAHFNLKNAARVFFGQKGNKLHISLAMDSYRGCLQRSKFKATTFAKDLFSSEIIDLLLKSKQESLAKGAIENMETAFLKFKGVLALSKHNKKPFDRAYFERLSQYIDKKIENEEGGKTLASLSLVLSALQRSSLPLGGDYSKNIMSVIFKGRGGGPRFGKYTKECDPFVAKNVFDTLTKLKWEVAHTKNSRIIINKKSPSQRTHKVFRESAISELSKFPSRKKNVLNACAVDGFFNYNLMNLIHGRLMLDNDLVATDFKSRATIENFSERQQLKFFFSHMGQSKKMFDKLCISEMGSKNKDVSHCALKVPGEKNKMLPAAAGLDIPILKTTGAKYFVFTKKVDFGDVCEASTILFKDLKGGDEYDNAIKYMINSPHIDPERQYNCGDEDLELLLQ
jgi:hypothetical protein